MKKLLVLFTALCLLVCLCACGNGNNGAVDTNPAETSAVAETTAAEDTQSSSSVSVTVTDADGNPVKGVMLQICKDTCIPMVTDENGVALFNNLEPTAEHKLSVLSCPEGYIYEGEAEMYLVEGVTEYEVMLAAE